jgi:hypothetical protein
MKHRILSLGIVALTLAGSAAYADAHVVVGWNPFGWWGPAPVVYAPPRYYAPPGVYYGRGRWGDRDDARGRRDRDRTEHHDGGDRRR